MKHVAQVAALLSSKEVGELITLRYACAGGSKVAVMRDLFSRGYIVRQVWAMVRDQRIDGELFVTRPQMVDNYWRTWVRLQEETK